MAVVFKAGIRHTKVTDTGKKDGFAYFVLDLVEKYFPDAAYIQLVMDNLNTHFEGSLLETFGKHKTKVINEETKVYICSQTCRLAEHGRNRNQHHGQTMYRLENRK